MHKLLFLLLSVFMFTSCGNEHERDQIPYVYVNFEIYPNTIDYIPIGGYAYVSGGYKGIIIYHYLADEFKAYERACPYDPLEDNSRVFVDNSGLIAVDTVCGSQFLLTDGSPIKGPANIGLKQYRTRYDGYKLQVMN